MRNLVTLSAIVLVAAVFGSFWLIDRTAVTSFATVIENVRRATSVICLIKSQEESNGPAEQIEIEQKWYVRENAMRNEVRMGKTQMGVAVFDFKKNKGLMLDDRSKIAVFEQQLLRGETPNPLEELRNLKPENAKRLEDETIDGRRMEVYRLDGVRLMGMESFVSEKNAETRLWVDPETQLPSRLTIISTPNPDLAVPRLGVARSVWQFHWNEQLDPGLFKLEVPKGYTVQKESPPQAPAKEGWAMEQTPTGADNIPPAEPFPSRIDRVKTENDRAVIEGHIGGDDTLVLQIGRKEDKLRSVTWRKDAGPFVAVVESSSRLTLEDGSFGEGFIFTRGGATSYVSIKKTGPGLSGSLRFRDQTEVVTKDGVVTFADVVKSDGTSLPVTIRIEKTTKQAGPRPSVRE